MFKLSMQILPLFVMVVSAWLHDADPCNPDFCPNQGKNIACDNDGEFSKECKGVFWLVNMEPYKDIILHEHNMYRNYLAAGKLECFHSATRMPRLEWDNSLENMATYNVKTCVFAHDKCRSTPDYSYVGQNIYYASTSRMNITEEEFMKEAIYLWVEEFLAANHELMWSFKKTKPQTGHFTLLMNDRQSKVGCACLNNIIPGQIPRRKIIFTCNYTSNNIRHMPSYKPGPPASECYHTHPKYKALCVDDINPNDIYWYERSEY